MPAATAPRAGRSASTVASGKALAGPGRRHQHADVMLRAVQRRRQRGGDIAEAAGLDPGGHFGGGEKDGKAGSSGSAGRRAGHGSSRRRRSASSLPSRSGISCVASCLPSSTPHWSKELRFQMHARGRRPCVRTARSTGRACRGRGAAAPAWSTAGCRGTPCRAPSACGMPPQLGATSARSCREGERRGLGEAVGEQLRRGGPASGKSALAQGDEVAGNRSGRPDGSTDRTNAGRWCRLRPRVPGRSRRRPAGRRGRVCLPLRFHFQLLQIGAAAVPATGCRAGGRGCPRRGNRCSRLEQGQGQRQVVARRALRKNARPWRGAGQQLLEIAASRWPAPATGRSPTTARSGRRPSPRTRRRCRRSNAELSATFADWWTRRRSDGDGGFTQRPCDQPGARGGGVRQRLLGGEGLAGDDEQRGARVEAGEQRGDVGAIEVGDEMHSEIRQLLRR